MSVSLKKKKLFDYPIIFDHKPVVQAILNHLPLISCLSLLRTYPINISSIDLAAQRVREYLRLYAESERMDVFATLNYCSLTGGFLLSVLVDDPWWCVNEYVSDIDIVRSVNVAFRLRKEINGMWFMDHTDYTGCECITNVCTQHLVDNRSFQIIAISCSVDEYIETFDLSVCMNYFTSDKLVIKDPVSILKRVLVVKNPSIVPEKAFAFITSERKQKERIEKYIRRGFK